MNRVPEVPAVAVGAADAHARGGVRFVTMKKADGVKRCLLRIPVKKNKEDTERKNTYKKLSNCDYKNQQNN